MFLFEWTKCWTWFDFISKYPQTALVRSIQSTVHRQKKDATSTIHCIRLLCLPRTDVKFDYVQRACWNRWLFSWAVKIQMELVGRVLRRVNATALNAIRQIAADGWRQEANRRKRREKTIPYGKKKAQVRKILSLTYSEASVFYDLDLTDSSIPIWTA